MSTLYPFKFTHENLSNDPATEERPLTNPLEMLLCRYPLGQYKQNPNFALIHSRPNPFDEFQDPLWTILTSGSPIPLTPSADPLKKKFWMKTYSENKGTLEKLEAEGILRRTGEEEKQAYVTLIAVETVLKAGQWAEVCSDCGRREQLGDDNPRMSRCSKCHEAYYCNVECQTAHWQQHKSHCKFLRE